MKPAPFTYHDPSTVDELVGLLGSVEDVKLLAGGQSLMPMLNLRLAQPDHLIDLNTVDGLGAIESTPNGLRIGAMARQSALVRSPDVQAKLPVMAEALKWVGHFQTRTRGTLGGSMSHLDPAAELPAVALLYDAELTVRGPGGVRTVPMAEWPLAYMIPNLGEDEVLTSIEFTCWNEPHGYGFEEFARRYGDFAIVAVGALLAIRGDVVTRAAVAVAGSQPAPARLTDVETALVGQPAVPETFRAAAELARSRDAMSDSYITAGYRQRLAGVLTERALTKAAASATGGDGPMTDNRHITMTVNGTSYSGEVETRVHLADFLRHEAGLSGTHLGCEHGACGACTVVVDGEAVRSCLMLAVQAHRSSVVTIEGLATAEGLHPVQVGFQDHHGLQCGFCTPGMIMSISAYLDENPDPTDEEVREAISGNICRCTGYQGIVAAALQAAKEIRSSGGEA